MKRYRTGCKRNIIIRAIYGAIEWEQSIIDSYTGCSEEYDDEITESKNRIEDYKQLKQTLIGQR